MATGEQTPTQAEVRAVAADLMKLVGDRQRAAIMEEWETGGTLMRRLAAHNSKIAEFVGANWPTICFALYNTRPPTADAEREKSA